MSFLRRFFLHSPKRYIAAFIIAAVFTVLILYSKGFDLRINYMDAFTTAGSIVILLGLLLLVAYLGAFDTFGYGFSKVFGKKRYSDLVEYNAIKKEKRRLGELVFMPYITVGAVFLLVGLLI